MSKRKFKHIIAGIAFSAPSELRIAASGERLDDYEKEFNDLYFDKIKSAISHDKWGVQFAQIDMNNPRFVVDIFVNDPHEFNVIYSIINENPHRAISYEMMAQYWGFEKFMDVSGEQTP